MNNYDHLRQEIISMRKKQNLTQKQLANRTNISQSHISKYEKGLNELSISKYYVLKDYLENLNANETIEQYAVFDVFSATSNTTVKEIKEVMVEKNYTQIPVIDGESLTGSIQLKNLMDTQPQTLLKDILNEPFPLLPLNTSIETVKSLIKHGHLAVLTKKGSTFGIVTSADLI